MKLVNHSLYEKEKATALDITLNISIVVFAFLLMCTLAFSLVFRGFYINESSMLPTLTGAEPGVTGDYVYVNKLAKPDYGDIVIVYDDYRSDREPKNLIKRVIAFGGDSVKISDGVIYLKKAGEEKFKPLDEPYVDQKNNTRYENRYYNYPFKGDFHVVEEGCMFLVGDNRNVSGDSRDANNGINGDYPEESLLGVVTDFSMEHKKVISALYVFININIPEFFGVDTSK